MINPKALETFGKYDKKSLMAGITVGQGLKGRARAAQNPAPAGFPQDLWDAASQRANAMIARLQAEESGETPSEPETPEGWTFDKDAFCFGVAAGRSLEGWEIDGATGLPDGWALIMYHIHLNEPDTIEVGIRLSSSDYVIDWGDGNNSYSYSQNCYSHDYERGDYIFTFISSGYVDIHFYIDAQIREIGGKPGNFGLDFDNNQKASFEREHAHLIMYTSYYDHGYFQGVLDEASAIGTLRAVYLVGDIRSANGFDICSHIEYVSNQITDRTFTHFNAIALFWEISFKSIKTALEFLEFHQAHNHLKEVHFAFPFSRWIEMDKYSEKAKCSFFSDGNTFAISSENVSIPYGVTKIGTRTFSCLPSLTDVSIPNTVRNIGDDAFLCAPLLQTITIPNSVTSIGDGAFAECSSLTSIVIPDSVNRIGSGAFLNCTSLNTVKLSNDITTIESYLFEHCINLRSIAIPESVMRIEYAAFRDTGLTSVTINRNATLEGDAFPDNCTINYY